MQSRSTQPRLHSSYLIFPDVAVPLAAIFIAARLELPGSLGLRCSDRLRDRCKVDPAVQELPETRPEFDQTACVGPRLPLALQKRTYPHQNGLTPTRTDSPAPERTRLQDLDISPKHVAPATQDRVCFPPKSVSKFHLRNNSHSSPTTYLCTTNTYLITSAMDAVLPNAQSSAFTEINSGWNPNNNYAGAYGPLDFPEPDLNMPLGDANSK